MSQSTVALMLALSQSSKSNLWLHIYEQGMDPEEKCRKIYSSRSLHVSLATLETNCTIVLCNTDFFWIEQTKPAWNSSEF